MAGCVLRTTLTTTPDFGEWSATRTGNLNCTVSDAEDLESQIRDALEFLSRYRTQLSAPQFAESTLDFGVWQKDAIAIYSRFPSSLVHAAASVRFSIELSQYLSSDE